MRKTEADMIVKGKNVLGEEVQVRVVSVSKKIHEWGEKDIAKDCCQCSNCIDEQGAKNIIKIVKKGKRYISPPQEYVRGLCVYGLQAKILTPPRTALRRCRYSGNGHD